MKQNLDLDFELYEELIIDTINVFYEDVSMVDQKFVYSIFEEFDSVYGQLHESVDVDSLYENLIDIVQERAGVSLGAEIGGLFSKKQNRENIHTRIKDYHQKAKDLVKSSKANISSAKDRVGLAQANADREGHTFFSAYKARKELKAANTAHTNMQSTHQFHQALVKHAAGMVKRASNDVASGTNHTKASFNRRFGKNPGF